MWRTAMGVVSKTDENGNFIVKACGQPNMKMARHFLEWQRPEKWGKRRKRHVPHNAGVLVIGGDVTKKPEYDTTASVKARKWKSFSRKFRDEKTELPREFSSYPIGSAASANCQECGSETPRSRDHLTK